MRAEEPIVFVVDDDEGVRAAIRSLLASVGLDAEGVVAAVRRAIPE